MATDLPDDSVTAEMERIFRPLAGRAPLADLPYNRSISQSRPRTGKVLRRLTFAAPVLVVGAGVALALGYVRPDSRPSPIKTVMTSTSTISRPPVAAPRDTPSIAPVPSIEDPVDPQTTALLDDRGSNALTDAPARPAPQPARVVAERSALPSRVSALPTPAVGSTARESLPPRSSTIDGSVRRQVRPDRAVAPSPAPCRPGSLEDRCIYQDVLNADARLRLAYSRAKRSGVSNAKLTAITRRWSRARELSEDDPDGAIQRYDQLADTLDQARRGDAD